LLKALKAGGIELILDPKSAELATLGGFTPRARALPWAHAERPHQPVDFTIATLTKFCERIAEFAIAHDVDVVHVPTHFIISPSGSWLGKDNQICVGIRNALDRMDGKHIRIDYPLIANNEVFRDEAAMLTLIKQMRDLPFENLWLRISGFGMMSASAAGVRRYIEAASPFRELGRPIIADCVAGLVGHALCAFGAVSGISHGIAEKDAFNVNAWLKRSNGGGSKNRILLPKIDTYLYSDQAEVLLRGRGAKSLLGCNDASCCPQGIEDMFNQSKAHAVIQSTKHFKELDRVPQGKQTDFFLDKQLSTAGRAARQVAIMKLEDNGLSKRLGERSKRLERMFQVLENLHASTSDTPPPLRPAMGSTRPAQSRQSHSTTL
jgi:hypothetical protein